VLHRAPRACAHEPALTARFARAPASSTARPQTETLRQLYFSHAEVVALREQLAERDVIIGTLRAEAELAGRREASALQIAEKARQATQRVREEEEERFEVRGPALHPHLTSWWRHDSAPFSEKPLRDASPSLPSPHTTPMMLHTLRDPRPHTHH
jgi:hypothetical protein